jgi:hypothetical protein
MKMHIAIIGGVLAFSNVTNASTNQPDQPNNPFLLPSERIVIKEEPVVVVVEAKQCEPNKENELAKLLAKEIQEVPLAREFHPDVLGKWTKKDIESSRYIGLINGFRVYFHNEMKIHFSLDMNKFKSTNEKGSL